MKTVVGVLALVASAGACMGQISATALPIGGINFEDRTTLTTVYTGIPGPYSAFGAAAGPVGFDDYDSTDPYPTMILGSIRFVGGVTAVGGTMQFDFYDTNLQLANTFTVNLPQAGNFIWTITLGANGGKDSVFTIPSDGVLEISAINGATGAWFMTTTAPTVGSNNIAFGTGSTLNPQRYNAFELNAVPAPGALALVGLGGLVAGRRRR